jgi:hypothetical protein
MPLLTGSRRISVTINEGETIDVKADPLQAAKDRAAQAQAELEGIQQASTMKDGVKSADEMRSTAHACTKDCEKYQNHSPAGRKAHAIAAIAHDDAQKAYRKIAGSGSGHDLETRAKASKLADGHAQAAQTHKSIAKGAMLSGGGSIGGAMNTGSAGVVCRVVPVTVG